MDRIFKEIVQIMHHDYAGWKDKRRWDKPDYFLDICNELKKKGKLDHKTFTQLIEDYLLDFNDKHIYFESKHIEAEQRKDRGFRVRRFEEHLYVTEVSLEKRISTGMSFKSIGGYSVAELKEKHMRLLKENHPERENWNTILSLYDFGEIEGEKGGGHRFTFKSHDKDGYVPIYSVRKLGEALLITITDFMNPDAIVSMISENLTLFEGTDSWIIDVRVNYGGSDSSYFPLLPYIIHEEGIDLAAGNERMFFNCTTANAERELEMISRQLEETEDENAKQFLKVFKREWTKNKGQGFVEFDFQDILPETFIKGTSRPKSIVVLTDKSCGSSGESFVEACKKSEKVTVMGRATMGLNDYANLVCKKWKEGFELLYPTSRLSRIDDNEGMSGVGVHPHIYIPWTPAHLESDVDMNYALAHLLKNKVEEQ